MDNSPNLNLPYLAAAQAQKHVTHNEALRLLDLVVQAMVLDRTLASPPSAPANGARYLVAAAATGMWAGQSGMIAAWQDGAWVFVAAQTGWLVWVANEAQLLAWNGAAWVVASGASVNPTALVGINTLADSINRLALKSDASLFDNAGAGHQSKINKALAAHTASLLFQTGYSGRAEIGTTGDDNFHIKVSADGIAWNEAFVIDKATGAVSFPRTSLAGVNAGDVGHDVILLAGQSNAQGNGKPFSPVLDFGDPRVQQLGSFGVYANLVTPAIDPLIAPFATDPTTMGFAMPFARLYAASIPSNRRVLLVPCAVNGTGFSGTANPYGQWSMNHVGLELYELAIRQANLAIAAGPNNRFAGVLWHQGEADFAVAPATYAAYLDALIAGFRARINGAASSWFLLGRQTPDNVASNAGYAAIDAAHLATPARNGKCAVFSGQIGYVNDPATDFIHYNAAGQRFMGLSAFAALPAALANVSGAANPAVPAQVAGLAAGAPGPLAMPLTWTALASAPLDYLVQSKPSAGSVWTTFQHAASSLNAAAVTGLPSGTSCDFRVAGVNSSGPGPWSAIVTATTASGLLLDNLATAASAAYSVRKLRTAYAGAALRVRRSSDNAEQDIGFVANGLDTAALLAFAGAGAAFVSKWSDPRNANTAVQTDTTKQPRIVNAGALDILNSIAMPRWTGSQAGLYSPAGHPVGADFGRFIVASMSAGGTMALGSGSLYLWMNPAGALTFYDAGTNLPTTAMSTNALHAGGVVFTNSPRSAKIYVDAISSTTSALNGAGSSTANIGLGCYNPTASDSTIATGFLGEAIILGAAPSAADIAALLASQKAYFGTP